MQTNRNKIFLRGRLAEPPALSHTNHGVDYFMLPSLRNIGFTVKLQF